RAAPVGDEVQAQGLRAQPHRAGDEEAARQLEGLLALAGRRVAEGGDAGLVAGAPPLEQQEAPAGRDQPVVVPREEAADEGLLGGAQQGGAAPVSTSMRDVEGDEVRAALG